MVNDKADELARIAADVEALESSPLYAFRKENNYHMVFGEGDPDADILFIGEAPGQSEAKQGRPFVGASGRMLNQLLESIDLSRDDIYITNVVKDRPPDNRDPHKEEIALYTPFLLRQIEVIQPRVIATLGRFAMDYIFETFDMDAKGSKISKVRGQSFTTEAEYGPVDVVPLFHPAVALYNQGQRQTLFDDFATLRRYVESG